MLKGSYCLLLFCCHLICVCGNRESILTKFQKIFNIFKPAGRFAPWTDSSLWQAKRSALGRIVTRQWRAITQRALLRALCARAKSSPTAKVLPSAELNPGQPAPVNNTGATRLTKGARFAPGQIARLWRAKRLAFGRLKTHSILLSIRFSLTVTLSFFMHLIL